MHILVQLPRYDLEIQAPQACVFPTTPQRGYLAPCSLPRSLKNLIYQLVPHLGLEPRTFRLRVCSANQIAPVRQILVVHLGFEPNPCAFVTTVSTFLSTYCEPLTTNVTQNSSVFVAHIFLVDRKEIESFQPACKASSPPWYMTAHIF